MRQSVLVLAVIGLLANHQNGLSADVAATVGEQKVVFPAGYHGLNYFPDEPPALISKSPPRFLLVAGNPTTLMQGKALETAVPTGKPVFQPGDKNSFDNGYAGITSVYFDKPNKRHLAFYHAEDHVGMPKVPYNPDIQGAYWSVGLATSKDNGASFQRGGQILSASVTKKQVTKEHQGVGDVSVIADGSGTYLYAYYTDVTRRKADERATIGLARCRTADGGRPGAWFKYRDGEFKEKGLGGQESPVVLPPKDFPGEVIAPHVTYVPEWKKYVMVCNVVAYKDCESQKAEEGGIYYCHSDDGVKWTEPKRLVVGLPIPYRDREYVAHPSLYLEGVKGKSATGLLLYTYSPRWGTEAPRQPHHLASRPITITLSD
jgi:hypothetical protein